MKNIKAILSTAFILFFGFSMLAQTSIGIRGGVNFAQMNEDPYAFSTELEAGTMVGLNAAAFANFKFGDVFSLQPELQFIQKGLQEQGKMNYNGTETNVELTYRYSFIEVPILARADFGGEDVYFFAFAGPAIGYAISAEYSGENYKIGNEGGVQNGTFEQDLEWDKEWGTDGMKDRRMDLSAVVGLGVGYMVDASNKVMLDLRYNHDFLDHVDYEVSPKPEPKAIHNRGVAVTIGYAYVLGN